MQIDSFYLQKLHHHISRELVMNRIADCPLPIKFETRQQVSVQILDSIRYLIAPFIFCIYFVSNQFSSSVYIHHRMLVVGCVFGVTFAVLYIQGGPHDTLLADPSSRAAFRIFQLLVNIKPLRVLVLSNTARLENSSAVSYPNMSATCIFLIMNYDSD